MARDILICPICNDELRLPEEWSFSSQATSSTENRGFCCFYIAKRGYEAQMSCPRKRNKRGLRAKTDFLLAHERKAIREEVLQRDPLICVWCFEAILRRPSMEHIDPRMSGGPYSPENFALSHRKCNFRRGSMSVLQYMAQRANQSAYRIRHLDATGGSDCDTSSRIKENDEQIIT